MDPVIKFPELKMQSFLPTRSLGGFYYERDRPVPPRKVLTSVCWIVEGLCEGRVSLQYKRPAELPG